LNADIIFVFHYFKLALSFKLLTRNNIGTEISDFLLYLICCIFSVTCEIKIHSKSEITFGIEIACRKSFKMWKRLDLKWNNRENNFKTASSPPRIQHHSSYSFNSGSLQISQEKCNVRKAYKFW